MLPESVIRSFYSFMASNRSIVKVCNERLTLFVRLISDVDQLNRYRVQQDLVLVVIGARYVMVRLPAKRICNMHLSSFFIN